MNFFQIATVLITLRRCSATLIFNTSPLRWLYMAAGLLAISITLLARWISVAGVVAILRLSRPMVPGTISILTWGGLRGGISVALALSLPSSPDRNIIVAMTYATVIFSIIVQGLTVGKVTAYFVQKATAAGEAVTARDARSLS